MGTCTPMGQRPSRERSVALAVVVAVLLYFVTQAAGGCASMLDGSGESVEREVSQFCHGGGGFYQPCLLMGQKHSTETPVTACGFCNGLEHKQQGLVH